MLVYAYKPGFSTGKTLKKSSVITISKPVNSKNRTNVTVKHTSKKYHRRGKRKSVQNKQQLFSAIGVNVNGIRGKWSTLKNIISKIKPLVWNIQETKCINEGGLKLKGFTVFEHIIISQNGGGGLAMGCATKLSPVLTRNGGDEAEALSVDIKLKKVNILLCTAYGPQNSDLSDKKDNFWQYLDEEAKKASNNGKGFIFQGDLNSWVGSDTIPHDPRPQNDNGKRFKTFLIKKQFNCGKCT